MAALRILTFNWHEAYLCLLAKTGHQFTVVDKNKGGYPGWLHGTRPVPTNVRLLPVGSEEQAMQVARAGGFDLAICHNLSDLALLSSLRIPKIVVFHNKISTEIALFRIAGQPAPQKSQYIAQFRSLFDGHTHAVFISESKRADAEGIDGRVILPGIDLDEYGGYRGDVVRVLRVGNFFTGRDIMLGQTAAVAALKKLPVTVLGINPEILESHLSSSWEDLKEHFCSHRVLLNTTVDGYEDGYNLAMLEAMATGMPAVTTHNETSPIQDGVNGFISKDLGLLHTRLRLLLKDRELARTLGAKSRETVADKFPLDRFVESWNSAFHSVTLTGSRDLASPLEVPGQSAPILEQVQRLMDERASSEARSILEDAVEKHPESAQLWKALGLVYRRLGRIPEATRAFWAAARMDPNDKETQRLHLETLQPSLTIHPENNPEAWVLYCLCNGRGIDVGCGGCKTHPSAIGVDTVPAGAVYPSGQANGVRSRADVCASGDALTMFRDGELDYVISRHNLEHYQDPLKALEEWRRVLKPGGLLGVVLPDDTHNDTIHMDRTHKHVFTPDSLRRLMRYFGGFEILYLDTCLYRWSFTAILQKQGGDCGRFDYLSALRRDTASRCARYAGALEESGNPNEALECWREVAVLDPDSPSGLEGQLRMLRRLGRREEGEGARQDIERRFPGLRAQSRAKSTESSRAKPASCGSALWPLVSLAPPAARKRILLSYCANPMTTGTYLERALRRRHEVLTWGPSIDHEILKVWDMQALQGRVQPTDLGYEGPNVAAELERLAPGWKPDIFLCVESGVRFPVEGQADLGCPKVCYLIDTHVETPNDRRLGSHLALARQFDIVFLAQQAYVDLFRSAGIDAYWLPLACDPEIHRDQQASRIFPIGFVGSLNHQRRIDLLRRLESRLAVHVKRCFLEEMSRVFSQSKIVFNNAVNNDLNMRVFEAMAAGALLLTDPAPGSGLEEFFTDGKHLAVYRRDDDIVDVAERWLSDEVSRERVARAGQAEVLARHTYEHRIAFMEQILFPPATAVSQPGVAAVPENILVQARAIMTSRRGSTAPRAVAHVPTYQDVEAKLARGRILLSSGRCQEAHALFSVWSSEEPASPYAPLGLGCVALAWGEWEKAEHHFRAALELCPDEPKALCGLGLALSNAGREMEATDALLRTLQLDPTEANALQALVRAASAVGRFAEARDAVKRYVDCRPPNPHLLFSCAVLSARLGETGEALQFLDRIESLDPTYPDLARWRSAWASSRPAA